MRPVADSPAMRDHSDPQYSLGVSVLLDELETGFDSPAATPKRTERRVGSKAVDLDATQQLDYDCTGSWSADTLDGKRPLHAPPPQAARSSVVSTREPSTDEEADARLLYKPESGASQSSSSARHHHHGPAAQYAAGSALADLSLTSEQVSDLFHEMEDCMDYLQAMEQVTRARGDDLRRELEHQYGRGAVSSLEARLEAQKDAMTRASRFDKGLMQHEERGYLAEKVLRDAPLEEPSGVDESMLIFSDGFEPGEVELLVEGFAILRPPTSAD